MTEQTKDNTPHGLVPTGGRLLLVLRAALKDFDGGPYLWVIRTDTPNLYRWEVKAERPPVSRLAALALTGNDALAHGMANGWHSLESPTAPQLRGLMRAAVKLRDIEEWAANFTGWNQYRMSPAERTRQALMERGNRTAAHQARMGFRP